MIPRFRPTRISGLRAAFVGFAMLSLPWVAHAQATPQEAYGPYNATFLADGLGLKKPIAPPSPVDGRTIALLDRLGVGKQLGEPEPLLAGTAAWTLSFWFHSSDSPTGIVLLAGIGDPASEDARFIGIEDGRLGLWLGSAQSGNKPISSNTALRDEEWHLALAASDGQKVTLYADGRQVASSTLAQGAVAAWLEMAPPPVPAFGQAGTHFGGKIVGLKIYREAITAEQTKAMAAAHQTSNCPLTRRLHSLGRSRPVPRPAIASPPDPSMLPPRQGWRAEASRQAAE